MKRLFVLFVSMLMAACGGSSGGGGGTATTPVAGDNRCITSSTLCNNGVYAQYNGWRPYAFPYGGQNYDYNNYFQTNGACGCPVGYAPAYNSQMGMGCYRQYNGWNYNITWAFQYSVSSYNNGWAAPQSGYNFQQYSNIQNGNGANCAARIATSCLMNQVNSCGAGSTCQEVTPGSGLGLCVSGGYNNGYNYNYNGGYNYNYNTGYYNNGYYNGNPYPYNGYNNYGYYPGFGVGGSFNIGFGTRYY